MNSEYFLTPEAISFLKKVEDALVMDNAPYAHHQLKELVSTLNKSKEKPLIDVLELPRKIKSLAEHLANCTSILYTGNMETAATFSKLHIEFMELVKARKIYHIIKPQV